jgi:hypothetical protein
MKELLFLEERLARAVAFRITCFAEMLSQEEKKAKPSISFSHYNSKEDVDLLIECYCKTFKQNASKRFFCFLDDKEFYSITPFLFFIYVAVLFYEHSISQPPTIITKAVNRYLNNHRID